MSASQTHTPNLFLSSVAASNLLFPSPARLLNASGVSPELLSLLFFFSHSFCLNKFIPSADLKYHLTVSHTHASESSLDLVSTADSFIWLEIQREQLDT